MSSQQHPPSDASSPSTIPDDPSPHHTSQPAPSPPSSANAPSNLSSTAQQPLGGAAKGETSAANHPASPSLDLPNGVSSGGNTSMTASSQPNGERTPSSASSPRPTAPSRSMSYKAEGDIWVSSRASNAFSGAGDDAAQRTTRAASDGAVLGTGFGGPGSMAFVPSGEPSRAAGGISSRLSSLGSEDSGSSNNDEQAFFRDYQRRSLEYSASQRLSAAKSFASPPLASARLGPGATSPFFQPPSFLSTTSATASGLTSSASNTPASSIPPPLLSPTSTSPPSSLAPPSVASSMMSATSNSVAGSPPESGPAGSKGATLHLGDLDVWMDEAYVRECCSMMGWDVVNVKMSRGASPSSGYCFLTFTSATDASRALSRFNAAPPVLMPRSGKTFKLNWGTGLPGSQPTWDGEFSVFVGDLAREVGEADLLALFSPLFPSTKSAKVLCDPSTGLSRGFGFVRFADESDMQRALHLGSNSHSGLLLHGRTIRISEASGSGGPNAVEGLPHLRERTRTRSGDTAFAAQGQQQHQQPQGQQQQQQGYFPPYPTQAATQQNDGFPENPYASPSLSSAAYGNNAAFPSPMSPYGPPNPAPNGNGLMSPSLGSGGPGSNGGGQGGRQQRESGGAGRNNIPAGSVPPGGDPNNTTVFVGGLPACISEETLRSFFHHFGEITYCKIPPGKGCGFVQFVRRQDAELAIAKMNDFPIHGKSRIRLSWGRSQGDKQVEHVRKLASALGVPFDAVWRMVQGQDNSTIKQIASAVGGNGTGAGGPQSAGASSRDSAGANGNSRMDVRAVANAAGLSESEVLDLVKNGNSSNGSNSTSNNSGTSSHSNSTAGSDFFARSAALTGSMTSLESATSPPSSEPPRGSNPYSRVSPSSFSSAFAPAGMMPLSPPPTAGPGAGSFAHHQASHPPFAPAYPAVHSHSPSPYTAIRPESYLVQPPTASPYERVDFADGGRPSPNGFSDRYQPHAFAPGGLGGGKWTEQPHPDLGMGGNYTTAPPPPGMPLDESFGGLSLGGAGGPPRSLPPPMAMGRPAFQPTAPDFFPGALASPTTSGAGLPALGGEPTWSWNGVSAA